MDQQKAPCINVDSPNGPTVPTRKPHRKQHVKSQRQKEEKRIADLNLLQQIDDSYEQRVQDYLNIPGMIANYERLRETVKRVDFERYFNTLESRLDGFQTNRDQCVSEFQQQETNLFLMIPLSLAQQKRFVSVLMKFINSDEEAKYYVWTAFINKMYLHAPNMDKVSLHQSNNSTLDDPAEPIPKSLFLSLLYVLSNAYVEQAIQRNMFEWDTNAMYEIIGLLDRKTAQNVLTKLALRRVLTNGDLERTYYDQFMERVQFYIIAHTNFYARVLESFELPAACHGALLAYNQYTKYMEQQDTKKPILFTSQGQTVELKIAKLTPGSQEHKRMAAIVAKITRACKQQLPF